MQKLHSCPVLLAAVMVAIAAAGDARARSYTQTAVALSGEPAPGTGGTYTFFGLNPSINASGVVDFFASFTTGVGGIFVDSGGSDTAVALPGDTAPDTGGGTYQFVTGSSINASGDVVFRGDVTGGTVSQGLFVDSGGTDTAVALAGETAPGTGGGTYSLFGGFPAINASGDVVFTCFYGPAPSDDGLFLASGGTDRAVALVGDPAPGTGGGTYSDPSVKRPAINDAGDVAFFSWVTGTAVNQGIFLDSGGTHTAVALEGEPAPGTGGGTYSGFGSPSINSSGDVAFRAFVDGGTVSTGYFVASGGGDRAVALAGDAAPGTGGGTYWYFEISSNDVSPSINDAGDVAFFAYVTGGTPSEGIFVDSGGTDSAVALPGDEAPGTGGGTYSFFERFVAIDASGDVVFRASVTGGSVSPGIFKAVASSSVPLPPWSALAIAALLGASGLAVARRATRRA